MENFNFFVGVDIDEDILKASTNTSKENRYKNMIVKGLASDSSEDVEGEFMEPDGFEFDEFLKSGYLNLEHFTTRKGDPQFWIGEPLGGEVKNNKFFIEGKLWEHHPLARNFWDTMLIMKSSGSTRRPGFSIEGKALERDPLNKKRVTKAKINNVALTFSPVNKNSFMDIVKGTQKEDYIEPEVDMPINSNYIFEFSKEGKKYGITKSFKIEEIEGTQKSVTTDTVSALRKESLDGEIKNIIRKSLRSGRITPRKAFFVLKKFQE